MNGDLARRVGGLESQLGLDAESKVDRHAIAAIYGDEAADALAAGAGAAPVVFEGQDAILFRGGKLIVGIPFDAV